ncbi:MAG: carbohydrate ABC transporter permease [Chloroflexi bacterium]|nr:carbohydrate ABC transporter permease [Chloroflexota bacterium]MCI0577618.1 carbohydrate ABC transporter permease [Chloroflexota bacterium]MCI0644162.1 carbohydrate ABC transporter permease [Chloroflexota bacterium]MCI0725255.1 carbohydrate ABC transporter permease [Chloroflexota bacterium]
MANVSMAAASQKPERHPQARRIDAGRVVMYLVLLFGAMIALIPFILTINISLMTQTEAGGSAILPVIPQWGNYLAAWEGAEFGLYFWNSVRITFITVLGQLVFCTMAAYAFARIEFPAKEFLFALILSTLILPEAITWVPNFITVSWLGRVTPFQWVNNWPALTVPFMASAFSILILRQFFQQIPGELWDSAQIDGAGHIRYLIQVVLPLSRAAVVTVILFSFIGTWNSLAWPILVTTTPDWRPISYGLLNFVTEGGTQVHLQMAGAMITILPLILVYFFTQRQFTEGIATTGLKG